MEVTHIEEPKPTLVEWLGDDRGDNLAIKVGRRIYTVDKYGTMISQRYRKTNTAPLPNGTTSEVIEGLTDLKVGHTYSISQDEAVLGKLMESNLFGYRFLAVTTKGDVQLIDIDYDVAIAHCQVGHIRTIRKM